ncbi:MAG TPA: hypothetical protein VHK47_09235 [Polyangia bacterium]|jgi:hypothetical protein|nr:hypothetical protein [Polyangia bacterium]
MPSDKSKLKADKRRKRTWQRPVVKTGTLFESNSLACGKLTFAEECQQSGAIKSS